MQDELTESRKTSPITQVTLYTGSTPTLHATPSLAGVGAGMFVLGIGIGFILSKCLKKSPQSVDAKDENDSDDSDSDEEDEGNEEVELNKKTEEKIPVINEKQETPQDISPA